MTADEKQEMLLDLASGGKALLIALNHLPETDVRTAPAPGRWSVLECLEHVVLVEDYLFGRILAASESGEPVGSGAREQRIRARAADRSRPVTAPDAAIPTGRYRTVDEATRAFVLSREPTVRFVQSCNEDLRSKVTTHPIIGPANCYEILLMMAAHPRRHAGQIVEIRGALSRPTLARSQGQS